MTCVHLVASGSAVADGKATTAYRCRKFKRSVSSTECEACPKRQEPTPPPEPEPTIWKLPPPLPESDFRPMIDVCTTAIPRATTAECIGSFLRAWSDRKEFHVRWLFHLDRWITDELDGFIAPTMQQALEVSADFDEATIEVQTVNRGYGCSVFHLMEKSENPVLWIEDDKHWKRDFTFSLADILKSGGDQYLFHPRVLPGSTSPAYWSRRMVTRLLQHKPSDLRMVSERSIVRIGWPGLRTNHAYTSRRSSPYEDYGGHAFAEVQIPKPKIAKAYFDVNRKEWVKT